MCISGCILPFFFLMDSQARAGVARVLPSPKPDGQVGIDGYWRVADGNQLHPHPGDVMEGLCDQDLLLRVPATERKQIHDGQA